MIEEEDDEVEEEENSDGNVVQLRRSTRERE